MLAVFVGLKRCLTSSIYFIAEVKGISQDLVHVQLVAAIPKLVKIYSVKPKHGVGSVVAARLSVKQ